MRIVKRHGMTRQGAKETAGSLFPALVERHKDEISNPTFVWRGDVMEFSFQALALNIKGTLQVTDTEIVLDVALPSVARLFEGTIRTNIERELDRITRG
jgi:hypothetical protein